MAYTDGLMILGSELAATQVETAAADIKEYVMPCNVTVLQFGVLVSEDFTDHTINPVVKLQKRTGVGVTAVDVVTLTLANTTNALKQGDGVKPAQTAITADTDIDDNDVILAYPGSFPVTIKQGECIVFAVTTASGSAGGAITPFAIVRIDGIVDGRSSNVWTATAAG